MAAKMAPYLLFGFAVAGLLHVSMRKEFVQRWLGKPGLRSVFKASILGVQTTGVDRGDAVTPVAAITITPNVSSPQLSIIGRSAH